MSDKQPSANVVHRRQFLTSTAAISAGGLVCGQPVFAGDVSRPPTAETLTKRLYDTLSDQQRSQVCFDWDHRDRRRGLLRTFVANNWNITPHEINSDFYSDDQRDLIRGVFEAMIDPSWHERYDQQLDDDAGGFGNEQSIAIFGRPGDGNFELVMTGRHMTLRCDGNSTDHMAFGGPIFYGHAPEFNESASHPDNVFWDQALAANKLYQMLDGKQQKAALLRRTPREQDVAFRGDQRIPGLAVADMSDDQKTHLQEVLAKLVEPYRLSDREEVTACLKAQGGLDACRLAYYSDKDLGQDGVWDNWRLEGPAFVWHYRGAPHVHVWVNVADSPNVALNA